MKSQSPFLLATCIKLAHLAPRSRVRAFHASGGPSVSSRTRTNHRLFATPGGDAASLVGIRILDEEATLAQSAFPIEPSTLTRRCQEVVAANFGADDPEAFLAPSFEFVGPFDGPLDRVQFSEGTLDVARSVKACFPDQSINYHDFHVDPLEPNRVWFRTRATATMTERFEIAGTVIEPNGKRIIHSPQVSSMAFDEHGRVTEFSAGFVIDRRYGNTRGLSNVYAVFRHIGLRLPFPEARPWEPSVPRKFFEEFNLLVEKIAAGSFGGSGEGNEEGGGQTRCWWRKEVLDRLQSKPENKWAVPPIEKEI